MNSSSAEIRWTKQKICNTSIVVALGFAISANSRVFGQKSQTPTIPGRILVPATLEVEQLGKKVLAYSLISVEPTTGEWKNLIEIPAGAGEPIVSRDGTHCYFVAFDVTGSGRVVSAELSFDADNEPRRVSRHTGSISCGPDGTEVIISARDLSAAKERVHADKKANSKSSGVDALRIVSPPAGHWRVRLDNGTEQKLGIPADWQVEDWSPDGKWLLATSWRAGDIGRGGYGDLFLLRPDGSERRQLTKHGAGCSWPKFSSDGTEVAYCFSKKDEKQGAQYSAIRIINVEAQEDREPIGYGNSLKDGMMTPPYTWYYFPSWSQNDEWLAVSYQKAAADIKNQEPGVLLISKDGTRKQELRLGSGAYFSARPRRTHWQ
jgi:hypothetical protein